MAKQRPAEALEALQWLRGWVPATAVAKEYQDLQRYTRMANVCESCEKATVQCPHPSITLADKLRDQLTRRVLKPSLMIFIVSVFAHSGGLTSMRSYMVLMLKAFGVPMDANWATVRMNDGDGGGH